MDELRLRLGVAEDSRQRGQRAVHFLFGDDVGRQHPDDGIVRHVEEQPVLHTLVHQVLADEVEFHADHQPVSAHFANTGKAPLQIAQPGEEILAHPAHLRQQAVKNVVELKRHPASQRAAAKRRACMPGEIAAAAFSLQSTAPRGSPQAIGFAIVTMSGITAGSCS